MRAGPVGSDTGDCNAQRPTCCRAPRLGHASRSIVKALLISHQPLRAMRREKRICRRLGGLLDAEEGTPRGSEPGKEPAEIVSGGGEDGVGGVAMGAGEIVWAHAMFGLGVADDRFDRRAAAEFGRSTALG